jgi:hypothetical protein
MVDSYSNSFYTTEHRLLAYSRGSDLLSWLSISLRAISRTKVQMGIQGFMQAFPELQNNFGSSIGHNPQGYSIEINYPRHIQLY